MKIIYIADNGFSQKGNHFYYTRINDINSQQYKRYFSEIIYVARKSQHKASDVLIPTDKVFLINKYNIFKLWKILIDHKKDYDAIVTRNGIFGAFAVFWGKIIDKPTISYCGSDPQEFLNVRSSFIYKILGYFLYFIEKMKMKYGDYAHYCTRKLYERYPHKGYNLICSNVNVVYNRKYLEHRLRMIKKMTNKCKIGLLGHFGNDDRKGIATVIRSLEILGDNFTFEVVGNGNPERYIELAAKIGVEKRVSFLGSMSNVEDINNWLDSIDVYVQPSFAEGLPRASIEAMSHACPVIASNTCGMVDILDCQYLIKPGDYKDLAYKISMYSNKKDLMQMASKNIETARCFDKEARDLKLDNFYYRIINEIQSK